MNEWIKPAMLAVLLLGVCLFGMAQADMNQPMSYPEFEELKTRAGEVYRELFSRGPNADLYGELGRIYFEDEHPNQAKFYYELGVSLRPDDAELRKGLEEAQLRLDYLASQFAKYSEKANVENDPKGFGSMAAIKFHQGFHKEAIEIIKNGVTLYGEDQRFAPLVSAFQKDIQAQNETMAALNEEFKAIQPRKDVQKSLDIVGQMAFVSLGNPKLMLFLDGLKKVYPGSVNEESYHLFHEFTKTYPN